MFRGLVGLTAIEVSLCGPFEGSAQSVLALAPVCLVVVQIAVPVFTGGLVPNTPSGTGAGAPRTLWLLSTGCGSSPATPASGWPRATTTAQARMTNRAGLTTTSFARNPKPPGVAATPPQICVSNMPQTGASAPLSS